MAPVVFHRVGLTGGVKIVTPVCIHIIPLAQNTYIWISFHQICILIWIFCFLKPLAPAYSSWESLRRKAAQEKLRGSVRVTGDVEEIKPRCLAVNEELTIERRRAETSGDRAERCVGNKVDFHNERRSRSQTGKGWRSFGAYYVVTTMWVIGRQ